MCMSLPGHVVTLNNSGGCISPGIHSCSTDSVSVCWVVANSVNEFHEAMFY